MLLKERHTGHMVEVEDVQKLCDLFHQQVEGRYQHGEEAQDIEHFNKNDLLFLSGEELPRCWKDPDYRRPLRSQH